MPSRRRGFRAARGRLGGLRTGVSRNNRPPEGSTAATIACGVHTRRDRCRWPLNGVTLGVQMPEVSALADRLFDTILDHYPLRANLMGLRDDGALTDHSEEAGQGAPAALPGARCGSGAADPEDHRRPHHPGPRPAPGPRGVRDDRVGDGRVRGERIPAGRGARNALLPAPVEQSPRGAAVPGGGSRAAPREHHRGTDPGPAPRRADDRPAGPPHRGTGRAPPGAAELPCRAAERRPAARAGHRPRRVVLAARR